MKKNEIDGIVKENIKRIDKQFQKAIENFENRNILEFRSEVKKLKVFLHLLNMEFEEGLSCHITKKMKKVYGYLGIIQNFQLQENKTFQYVREISNRVPVSYVNMLERELAYWKKMTRDFIESGYHISDEEKEITDLLPGRLDNKTLMKFIHYSVYELQLIVGRKDEEALNVIRKFLEDIYYNLEIIKPLINPQHSVLFNENELRECLELFLTFRDKCTTVVLLQTFKSDRLDNDEKQLIKQMEEAWLLEKTILKEKLIDKLDSMHIKEYNLQDFTLTE